MRRSINNPFSRQNQSLSRSFSAFVDVFDFSQDIVQVRGVFMFFIFRWVLTRFVSTQFASQNKEKQHFCSSLHRAVFFSFLVFF